MNVVCCRKNNLLFFSSSFFFLPPRIRCSRFPLGSSYTSVRNMAILFQIRSLLINFLISFFLPHEIVSLTTIGTLKTKDVFMLTGSTSGSEEATSFDLSALVHRLHAFDNAGHGHISMMKIFFTEPVVLKSLILKPTELSSNAREISIAMEGSKNCSVC